MINENEKEVITSCAKRFDVSNVYLFGSSLEGDSEPNDIDIGIKGIEPGLFFKFYGELIKRLPKPIDVIDLSQETLFAQLVEKNGIRIYAEKRRPSYECPDVK